MIRKLDDIGRIVIPKEMRKKLKITTNDDIVIDIIDNMIILTNGSNDEEQKKYLKNKISILENLSKTR